MRQYTIPSCGHGKGDMNRILVMSMDSVTDILTKLGLGLHVIVNWAVISDCIDNYCVTTG